MEKDPSERRREQVDSVRALRREFITTRDAAIVYDMERHRVIELADAAGALYRVSQNLVLIKKDVLDVYLERFHVHMNELCKGKEDS